MSNQFPTAALIALKQKFAQLYGTFPTIFRAPGRVNLIGEHTDYNDGFVMPVALDLFTYVAATGRPDRQLHIYSDNLAQSHMVDLDRNPLGKTGEWTDYVRGVAGVIESHGEKLRGANLAIHGEVPLGSGLSSSAALEVAVAFALLAISNVTLDRTTIAKLCQLAEHLYPQTMCGIMDQFISCHGQKGQAMVLDCRSLAYRLLPLPANLNLMICNTMVKHDLASSAYNQRRRECDEGVNKMSEVIPGILALRDVTPEQLENHRELLSPTVYKRCRHVITENARVLQAADALRDGKIEEFGRRMAESHRSLRDDYEVSCEELDTMVEIARGHRGVLGARMTGGGFGGCTINLVDAARTVEARQNIAVAYEKATGIRPLIYVCRASQGAQEIFGSAVSLDSAEVDA